MEMFLSLIVIAALIGTWYFSVKNPDTMKKFISIIIAVVSFIIFGIHYTFFGKDDKTENTTPPTEQKLVEENTVESTIETSTSATESKDNSTDKFYELNKIKEEYTPGNQTLTIDHYKSFAEGALTLEGVIMKFGMPTNAIGAEEGDSNMEVIYPTDEKGHSVGLIFKKGSSNFGEWVLKEKYVVETDGVSIAEYQ